MTKRGIRRLIILIVVLALGAGAIGGALMVRRSMNAEEIARAREQGMALYNAGELEAALPLLGKYIGGVKTDPEVLIAYAECRLRVPMPNNGHIPRAIAALRAATELQPENIEAKEALLELYLSVGFFTETNETADAILAIDPTNEIALFGKVNALISLNRPEDAIDSARVFADTHGDRLGPHRLFTQVLSIAGRPLEEQADYIRSLEDRFVNDQNYLAWRAGTEYDLWREDTTRTDEQLDRAIAFAKQAAQARLASAPGVAYIVFELLPGLNAASTASRREGGLLASDDSSETGASLQTLADELLARSLDDATIGPELAVEALKRAWWAGRQDLAASYAARIEQQTLAENPTAAGWVHLVTPPAGQDALEQGTPEDASESSTATGWQRVLSARDALAGGDPETALRRLSDFQSDDRELAAIAAQLSGVAYRGIGDLRSAAVAFRDAAEAGAIARDRAWRALGDTLADLGRSAESRAAYANLQDQESASTARVDRILEQLNQQPQPRLADTLAESIRSGAADAVTNPAVRARLAAALLLAGRVEEGLAETRLLLASNGKPDSEGLIALATLVQTEDKELALQLLETADDAEADPDVVLRRALFIARSGDIDAARAELDAQTKKAPKDEALDWNRALVRLLDEFDATAAVEAMWTLSDTYTGSATAQVAVLSSANAWRDLDLVKAALARLRQASGETSLTWRVFNARITLADDPTAEQLSEVALALNEILREDPDDFEALILAANTYREIARLRRESGDTAEVTTQITQAASFYDRAVGPGPNSFAFTPYIEMLLEYGRNREADDVLDRFLEVRNPPLRARADRVVLLSRTGRAGDAIDDQEWFARNGQPSSMLVLAQLYAESGDAASARRVIDDLPADAALSHEDTLRLANVYADLDDFQSARETLDSLPEQTAFGDRRQVIADFFVNQRRSDLVIDDLVAIAREGDDLDAWVRAIQAAVAAAQQDRVEQIVAEATDRFPGAPQLRSFLQEDSTRRFSQLVASSLAASESPIDRELYEIAESHAVGDFTDADLIARLDEFSASNPGVFAAWRLRSAIQGATGDLAGAIRTERAAAEALPSDPRPRRELLRLLPAAGQIEEAIRVGRELADLSRPDTYEPDVQIALLQLRQGDFNAALNRLTTHQARILADSRNSPTDALVAYLASLAGTGDTTRAYELLAPLRSSDAYGSILIQIAAALPNDELDTRRDWLNEATPTVNAIDAAAAWLGLAAASGDTADAVRALDLLGTDSNAQLDPTMIWLRAEGHRLAGQLAEAETRYRALITDYPGNAGPYFRLAEILAGQPDRARDALAIADQATRQFSQAPQAAQINQALGVRRALALRTLGRPAEARSALQEVLTADPDSPEALIALAALELDAGDSAAAASLLPRVRAPQALNADLRAQFADLQQRLD
jgi:thioredoxin-like negative regulator of GroEL